MFWAFRVTEGRVMSEDEKNLSAEEMWFRRFFDSVYVPGSTAGGIITAGRSNTSRPWDSKAERKRSAKTIGRFSENADKAIAILAKT